LAQQVGLELGERECPVSAMNQEMVELNEVFPETETILAAFLLPFHAFPHLAPCLNGVAFNAILALCGLMQQNCTKFAAIGFSALRAL
jgi:hypothetical protein